MIVAGLDQATTSGLAILRDRELVHAESFRPDGDTDGKICRGFREWLRPMLRAHKVEVLAMEEPLRSDLKRTITPAQGKFTEFSSRSGTTAPMVTMQTLRRLYSIAGHAIDICEVLNIPLVEINNKTWRSGIYGEYNSISQMDRRCAQEEKALRLQGRKKIGSVTDSEVWKWKALQHCKRLKWDIRTPDAAEAALIADYHMAMLNPRLVTEDLFTRERATA